MTRTTFTMTALVLVGLGIGVAQVRADQTQLQERLKQDLSVQLENITVAQALEQIGQKAGVKIVLSPGAVWKLPEGPDTRVSVTLAGRLSESLEKMLNNFFLRYAVGSETLTIYPRPELKHVIGRPSTAELKLLRNIYANQVSGSVGAGLREVPEDAVLRMLKMLAGEPMAIVPPEEVRTLGRILQNVVTQSSRSSGPAPDVNSPRGNTWTLATLLDGVERSGDPQKTWYIQGPGFSRKVSEIRIVPREEFWRAHLDQVVDVSFSGETGEAIMRTLAARGDLTIHFPGGSVPEALARTMTLEVQNAALNDVLERAASVLGVRRMLNISEGTLELTALTKPILPPKEASQPAPGESSAGGGYVGKISIPMDGGRYFIEFMLRESDLTDELRQMRQQKLRQILEELTKATPKSPDSGQRP